MQFLSAEWINAADQAVKDARESAPTPDLIIDQCVRGALDYRIVVGPLPSVQPRPVDPDAPQADAVFSQDLATAVAVATGETDAHQAFLLGRIRFEGTIETLIEGRAGFDWLHRALEPLLATTTFD